MTAQYLQGGRPLPGRHGVPTTERPTGPPPSSRWAVESQGVLQVPRLLWRTPRLLRMPRGSGEPVIDVPGWRAPEHSLAPLRSYLRWLGYDARGWGLGINRGDLLADTRRLIKLTATVAEQAGQPVHLVGWSLGGVAAREAARVLRDEVAQVITMGSPVVGGPAFTVAADSYSHTARQRILDRIERVEAERPIAQPITAIFTRKDAVVAWRACLDHWNDDVTHIEVDSTHLTLGVDPDVWEIVARQLRGAAERR